MQNEKRTLMEDLRMIWKALRVWNQILPGYFPLMILWTVIAALVPMFPLYLSAEMVNELSDLCRPNRLILLAGITVGGSFLLNLLERWVRGKLYTQKMMVYSKHEAYLFDAENHFQYEHLENAEISLKRSQILTVMNASSYGLNRVLFNADHMLENVMHVILSVALTLSLFRILPGDFEGVWYFINSWWAVIALVGVVGLNAWLSFKQSAKSAEKINQSLSGLTFGNNLAYAYMKTKGTDMHLFGLNRIAIAEERKYMLHPEWVSVYQKAGLERVRGEKLLNAMVKIFVFLFTAAKAWMGAIGIGNFILYQGTVQKFVQAFSEVVTTLQDLRYNNHYLKETFDYLELPNNMYQGTLAVEKRDDLDYEIEFRDVSFKYPRSEEWVLRHVNMKFKIGDKIAIVGENGSGKTTFIKLLCRLYDPTEGKILLNGIDITRYRYGEYMSLFSVAFQDYSLFAFTVAQNVAATEDPDEERVLDALNRVGLGDKIRGLPKGIHTNLGREYENDGVDFSGGEQQKVALARALYKNAPFVVLDEPTAALDPIAEAEVYTRFNDIASDKTSIFISHRLSSCKFCDEIAVFDHGTIVEHGNHDDLVANTSGKYHALWRAQAQYYN
ncbi:MAG: ABC transporter ATP-binding protein [Clostridia bacterium]|nr:ABC transporter ATP-binding protein [Clostridia bacterium]